MHSGTRSRELDFSVRPEQAFLALFAGKPYAFWLDPGDSATQGVTVMGAGRVDSRMVWARGGRVRIERLGDQAPLLEADLEDSGILDVLQQLNSESGTRQSSGAATEPVPSWIGWLGYEAGSVLVGTPHHLPDTPDAAFLEVDRAVLYDHAQASVRAVVAAAAPDAEAWLTEIADAWARSAEQERPRDPTPVRIGPVSAHWRHSPERYRELISACLDAIWEGDAYQLCLTNEVTMDVHPDPISLYRTLRRSHPAPHGGLLRFGDYALVSASPELFLDIDAHGTITTRPIKGTRPRSADTTIDQALAAELASNEKERAENLMIVDLMRNDFGRVAEVGTVEVTGLFDVESFPSVHQLVSTVKARLAAGVDAIDVLRAVFPPGSMTGAPKHSAMRILDRLEAGPRGIYSGVFGWLGHDGAARLAVVIRSIVVTPRGVSMGTGGGITAESDPSAELTETFIKIAPLIAVLGGEAPRDL